MATANDWHELLVAWSRALLSDPEVADEIPDDARRSGWLGFAGASELQIQASEKRLGVVLPHSYRTFLQASNGWRMPGYFISCVRSVESIDWYRTDHREEILSDIEASVALDPISDEEYFKYGDDQSSLTYRPEYLLSALQISDFGDASVYLLNPEVRGDDGEWEAWFFAYWKVGASRYRSFWEMMKKRISVIQGIENKRKRRDVGVN